MRQLHPIVIGACVVLTGCTPLVDHRIDDKPEFSARPDDGGSESTGDAASSAAGDAQSGVGADAKVTSTPDAAAPGLEDGGIGDGGTQTGMQNQAPLKVSVGEDFACGLRANGTIECWGADLENQTKLPTDRRYLDVACGDYHSCGIDSAGALVCAGRNRDGQNVSAPGPYAQVAAGDAHTCVLDAVGRASCWGANSNGQSNPPTDRFGSISAGAGFTCGLRAQDRSVLCWGLTGAQLTATASGTIFVAIDAGPTYVCGITQAHTVTCWGDSMFVPPVLGAVSQVSAGAYGACALLMDATVSCWYAGQTENAFANKAPFSYVAAGGMGACAVPERGAIVCEPDSGVALTPPPADFP